MTRSLINPDASVEIMAKKLFDNDIAQQLNDCKFCASTILSLIREKNPQIDGMSDFVVMCFSKVYQNKATQSVGISMMKELLTIINQKQQFNFTPKEFSIIIEIFIKYPPLNEKDSKVCSQLIQNICCLSDMAALEFLHHIEPKKFSENQRKFLKTTCKILSDNPPSHMAKYKDIISNFVNFDVESSKVELYGKTPTQQRIIEQEREQKIDKMFSKTAFSSKGWFFVMTAVVILVIGYLSISIQA